MASRRGAAGHAVVAPALGIALFLMAGCGESTPKTYPVKGRVVFADGEVNQLADGHVELELESDPTVRASGIIKEDGSFTIEMVYKGHHLKGALEGTHRGRILPASDDDHPKKKRPPPVHRRFLEFETSGMSIKVPAAGDITVTVSRR